MAAPTVAELKNTLSQNPDTNHSNCQKHGIVFIPVGLSPWPMPRMISARLSYTGSNEWDRYSKIWKLFTIKLLIFGIQSFKLFVVVVFNRFAFLLHHSELFNWPSQRFRQRIEKFVDVLFPNPWLKAKKSGGDLEREHTIFTKQRWSL